MKSAPFATSPMFPVIYIVAALIGLVVGALGAQFGLGSLLTLILAGFIPVIFGGKIRAILGSFLASMQNVQGTAPTAGSYVMRLVIGAIVATVVAFGVNAMSEFMPNMLVAGALTAFVTSIILSLVFTFIVVTR